jgi:hypothetical protein
MTAVWTPLRVTMAALGAASWDDADVIKLISRGLPR